MISSFIDIESANDILCSLEKHDSNTAVYDAINEAVNEFVEASNEETTKSLILDIRRNYGNF